MICTTYLDKIVRKVSCFTGILIHLIWVHDLVGIVYGLMTFPALIRDIRGLNLSERISGVSWFEGEPRKSRKYPNGASAEKGREFFPKKAENQKMNSIVV